MTGIVVTHDGRYIGEHTCPMDERERASRQAFRDLQERNGRNHLVTVEIERESCLSYALRTRAAAKEIAITHSHPAWTLADAALNHLSPEDYASFLDCEPFE